METFHKILEFLPVWFRPIAQTAYYTGMRRGEVVGPDSQEDEPEEKDDFPWAGRCERRTMEKGSYSR